MHYWYDRGVQRAGWDEEREIFRYYDASREQWSEPCQPPWSENQAETAGESKSKLALKNYGVDRSKINGAKEEIYQLNGESSTCDDCLQAITNSAAPNQPSARHLHFTIIGSAAERAQVLQDISKLNGGHNWNVQDYAPEHWAVARVGFVTQGKPVIYLQTTDGKVLHRQDDYRGIGDLETLRRINPSYDATKDPDLRKENILTLPDLHPGHYAALISSLCSILLLWKRPA